MNQSMFIRVTRDLSTPDEAGIGHLVGRTFFGNWDEKERMYHVTYNGLDWYWIKQDECESAECAFCESEVMQDSCICIDCYNEGLDRKYRDSREDQGMEEIA